MAGTLPGEPVPNDFVDVAGGALAGLGVGALIARQRRRADSRQISRTWTTLLEGREPQPRHFTPDMLADAPDIARRYLTRAIAPGTPLHRVVELDMDGTFTLKGRALPLRARQVLSPPARGFVWQADIGSGWGRVSGSDGCLTGGVRVISWTKFRMAGIIPVVRQEDSLDHARSAVTRTLIESVWVPAALLPPHGAHWTQTGPDTADIRFASVPDHPPLHVTLTTDGDILEAWTMRWSDANADRRYRLQPFGGHMGAWREFQGFRIPSRVEIGHHWGTPDYAPFFEATITGARY